MSYATRETERLHLPSNSDYWVEFRKRLTFGDRVAIQRALQDAVYEMAGGSQNLNFKAAVRLRADDMVLLQRVVVNWNLDDETGGTLPVSADTVMLLADEDAQAIIDRVNELNPRRTTTERVNFRNPSVESAERERGNGTAIIRPVPDGAAMVD